MACSFTSHSSKKKIMASSSLLRSSSYLTLFIISFLFITITINGENTDEESFENESLLLLDRRMEKTSRLHFYFHDMVSGRNPTAIRVVTGPSNLNGTIFGTVMIMDDVLTDGPKLTSKHIGKAQGMYAFVGQQDISLLMNMNLVFMEGEYNGSTLSVLGRNPINHPVREMPITGGSGLFRLARGYALAKTVWFHANGNAVVEYNVTVLHY